MGTIKIEFDLPNFKEELQINIVIHKDGEVVYNTTTPSSNMDSVEKIEDVKPKKTKKTSSNNNESSSSVKKLGGNMMSCDF